MEPGAAVATGGWPGSRRPHGPMLHSEHRGVDGMGFFSARGEIPEATDVLVAGLSGIRN